MIRNHFTFLTAKKLIISSSQTHILNRTFRELFQSIVIQQNIYELNDKFTIILREKPVYNLFLYIRHQDSLLFLLFYITVIFSHREYLEKLLACINLFKSTVSKFKG